MAYKDIKLNPKEPTKLAKDFQDLIDKIGNDLYDKCGMLNPNGQFPPFDPTIKAPEIPPFGAASNHPCANCSMWRDAQRTGKMLTCSCAIPAMHNIQYTVKG